MYCVEQHFCCPNNIFSYHKRYRFCFALYKKKMLILILLYRSMKYTYFSKFIYTEHSIFYIKLQIYNNKIKQTITDVYIQQPTFFPGKWQLKSNKMLLGAGNISNSMNDAIGCRHAACCIL